MMLSRKKVIVLGISLFGAVATAHAAEPGDAPLPADVTPPAAIEPAATIEPAVAEDTGATGGVSTEQAPAEEEDLPSLAGKIGVSYFGIFYGPGLQNGAGFQPAANGTPDQERPLILKNFLGVGYNFTDTIGVMPTAYWTFQPVMGMQFALKDPFIRLYDSSLLSAGNFNLYTDFRTHFGVSSESRTNDMYAGLQTFQIATYEFPTAKLTAGLYLSERVNFFGKQGLGNDFEMYVGPNVSYQVLKPLAVSLLAEFQFNHAYGDKPGQVWTDPIDLEPGLIWDVTENLMINPYFNLYPASLTAKSTSVGMMLSWKIM